MPASYTRGEKLRLAWLAARAVKQGMADTIDPRLKAEAERIEQRAAERGQAEADALTNRLRQARTAAAQAKAAMRTARGPERTAARREMGEHERTAQQLERALRRYQ
ncbi:DUF6257 family protein [Streptomyces sp. YIM S03343]